MEKTPLIKEVKKGSQTIDLALDLGGRKKITGPLGRYPMLFPGSQNGCGLGFKLGE